MNTSPRDPASPNCVGEIAAAQQKLLHELQVHQIELETQNHELSVTRDDLDATLRRYTELYELAPVAYLTLSPDGEIRQLNAAAAMLLHGGRDTLRGKNMRRFVAAEALPTWLAFMARVFARDRKESCEISLCNAAGRSFVARVEAVFDGRSPECRLTVFDVSDDQRGAAIRQSEQRFRAALANSPVTVFEADLARRYTWIHNPMFGLVAEQVVGRRNGDLLDAESAARLDALFDAVIAEGRSLRADVRIGAAGRDAIEWDVSIDPCRDAGGMLVGVVGAATDVTARKAVAR